MDELTFFQTALPIIFGGLLAIAAVVMLVTGKAPSYYRHTARRVGGDAESNFLYWSIVMATVVAAAAALYAGWVQLAL